MHRSNEGKCVIIINDDRRVQFIDWIDRRISAGWFRLSESRTETYELEQCLGGRIQYARLTLRAEPAEAFSFQSKAAWPSEDHTNFVLDGILDAVFPTLCPILGVSVTLENINWHDVNSCAAAFRLASYRAMEKIIENNMDITRRIYE